MYISANFKYIFVKGFNVASKSRRDFIKYAASGIVGLIVGLGAGYSIAPRGIEKVTTTIPVEKTVTTTITVPERKKLKAGWIYVGPIGDYGWTHAHDQGRKYCEKKYPWLETTFAESVSEADVGRFIDRMITEEKCDLVFTTSFGFMDATIEAGNKYPNKLFFHCSGFKRSRNVGTYFAEFYQLYYLNGLMAGALTKTNKVGYVAAYDIPEVIRHINAFSIGVKEVNPKATVDVRWLFSWFDPTKAREAAESLIAAGCDVLAFTEDSPTVIQVGEEYTTRGKPIYTFSHYSPMQRFGPNSCVSGQLVHWEIIYEEILIKAYLGALPSSLEKFDIWWMLREGAVELGGEFGVPVNPKFEPELKKVKVRDRILGELSVYDLVMERLRQMSEETVLFDPFTGPIYDQNGKLRIEDGRRASHDELWNMYWFVDNVIGKLPK
jgi:simple sugar transport system substrate-binding protein